LGLIPKDKFNFLWITDFPLFGHDEETNTWYSEHHPFTAPAAEDMDILESDPGKVRSSSYDMVLNGYEVASGSVRIHQSELQQRIFKILGITEEIARERFGFFVDALKYGTPPHAGIAPGIDRLCTLMLNRETIRDVIAFPKTLKAADLMCGSPSTVDKAQLELLNIDLKIPAESQEKQS
jgi:aspartyl-tRNA synthetase